MTSPLLECCDDCAPITSLAGVKPKIEEFINRAVGQGQAGEVSVYVRDLTNGPWFGINYREKFSPASLLKIPTMLCYLKLAEKDPSILEKKLTLTRPVDTYAQTIPPEDPIVFGREYTVQNLIERMIVQSDNVAKEMLCMAVGEDALLEVYHDLGMDVPRMDDYLTVKDYASFFRIMYNGSYISWRLSEWALGLLLETGMRDGIRAGVSASVPVASKFGERVCADGLVQFHECGIVYFPGSPYILCVMTRGTDLRELEKVVAGISRIIYAYLKTNSGK